MMRIISYIGIAVAILALPLCAFASDIQQQHSVLYPYQSIVQLQEEFLTGGPTTQQVGSLGWTFVGFVTRIASETNRPGLYRLSTTGVSGTVARLQWDSAFLTDPLQPTLQTWIARLNQTDANTQARIGSGNSFGTDPPTNGIYLEKLDADTNWFCVTRAGGAQTRVDTTVAVTTNFITVRYRSTPTTVNFLINGVSVCGTMTTTIPVQLLTPGVYIINSAAAAKTMDVDYFQINIFGLTR